MTDDRMALIEASQKADQRKFPRRLSETTLQFLLSAVSARSAAPGRPAGGESGRHPTGYGSLRC